MNELQTAILRTLVYFDIFDYPLTLTEVWKWLNITDSSPINHQAIMDNAPINANSSPITPAYSAAVADSAGRRGWLANIQEALGQMPDKIQTKNGFYFLPGREPIIEERLRRYGYAETKYRRALKFIKIFRFIPFIKMIAVCNNLAYSNCSKKGDIDLFIITQKNRLWLTRFLVVGLLKLLGVRPAAAKKQDTIDANFFLSEDNLNLESVKIGQDDIYLTYWIDQLVPIYDIGDTYQKFHNANQWIKKTLPNSFGYQPNDRRTVKNGLLSYLITQSSNLLWNWPLFEKLAKIYQLKIIPPVLKEMMNEDTRVVVNDGMLKFHRDDRRLEYQNKFNELINKLSSNG